MSDKKYEDQINPYADARTYREGIGPADYDALDAAILEGLSDAEIEDKLGIEEEVVKEYRAGGQVRGEVRDPNEQIHVETKGQTLPEGRPAKAQASKPKPKPKPKR